jgi:hypothetical protein
MLLLIITAELLKAPNSKCVSNTLMGYAALTLTRFRAVCALLQQVAVVANKPDLLDVTLGEAAVWTIQAIPTPRKLIKTENLDCYDYCLVGKGYLCWTVGL